MKSGKRVLLALFTAALLSPGGSPLASGYVGSLDLLAKIQPGVTKAQQVRDLLGAPARILRFPARGIEALEYDAHEYARRIVVSISVGSDGVVRDVLKLVQSGP